MALLVAFAHRTSNSLDTKTATAILQLINICNAHEYTTIASYILGHNTAHFQDGADIVAFLTILQMFAKNPDLKKYQEFWVKLWQKEQTAAVVFYNLNLGLFTGSLQLTELILRFTALQKFMADASIKLKPYEKACLIGLCASLDNESVTNMMTALANASAEKLTAIVKQLVITPHKFRPTDLINFIANLDITAAMTVQAAYVIPQRLNQIISSEGLRKYLAELRELHQELPPDCNAFTILKNYSLALNTAEYTSLTEAYYQFDILHELSAEFIQYFTKILLKTEVIYQPGELRQLLEQCAIFQNIMHYTTEKKTHINTFLLKSATPTRDLQDVIALLALIIKYQQHNCLPLITSIFTHGAEANTKALSERGQLCLSYCVRLKDKFPLHRIEALMHKLNQYDMPQLIAAEALIHILETTPDALQHPLLGIICSNALLAAHNHDHTKLITLLLNGHSHQFKSFINSQPSAEIFNALIAKFVDIDDPSQRLATILDCILLSRAHKHNAISDQELTAKVGLVITYMLACTPHDFAKIQELYQITTPSLERVLQLAEKTIALDAIILDPRGDRMNRNVQHDHDNIKRVINGIKLSSDEVSSSLLQTEIHNLILSEQNFALYQGIQPAELMPEQLKSMIKAISTLDSIAPMNKARLLLPLVEAALHYSVQMTMNDTQRTVILLTLIQTLVHGKRVQLQEIATGEGKSLLDAIKCSMFALLGYQVEFSTPALPDAARDLQMYLPLFKMLV